MKFIPPLIALILIALLLLALVFFAPDAQAQQYGLSPWMLDSSPPLPPWERPLPSYSDISPEQKKDKRDAVLKKFPEAAGVAAFTTHFGHSAVIALSKCDKPEIVKKLVAVPWNRLPHARHLIAAVAEHGQPVGEFLALRHEELLRPGAVQVFLQKPLDASWDLIALDSAPEAPPSPAKKEMTQPILQTFTDWRVLTSVAVALLLGLGIGAKARRRAP